MAITNRDRVGKGLDLLKTGLAPFVEREFVNLFGEKATAEISRYFPEERILSKKPVAEWDVSPLTKLMWDSWNDVFKRTLGHAERSLLSELREHRNRWAHQENFSSDDADRALDSMERLLAAISSPQADEVRKIKLELRRLTFDELARNEKRKSASTPLESTVTGQLRPWREVVTPHRDVASGRYQQAEFAADLWQVHIGEGADEYRNPTEFFRRTYLTDSLKTMLTDAVLRLTGKGGNPVVQLQTNFGGGKTHSMLALYHMISGTKITDLPGIEPIIDETGVKTLPKARPVVLVGNKISPGNPSVKPDGTVVRTLWGELAWQLGGKKAFERIRSDDEKATSPGDVLRELFVEYGPCLILIDEWVAYARQLHDQSDLPAGGFETQFSFAQALTESAKLAKNCLLVISLPASDTATTHTQGDDVEVGGQRGREALDRLRNVVGRLETSWRPASAEEGFEIVRRRLFEPLSDPKQFTDRDVVCRAFAEMYRAQAQEFPPECRDADYERRLKAAYPIHPELFDRLYNDWSTLVKFQRTRGVLRLMAAVIYSLWEKGDKNALIMPANVSIDDPRVQYELTRYLSDNWTPIIEKDVDGANSLPLRIDNEVPNLGKYSATRRIARTIYLGSAPLKSAAQRGLEDRRVKLGCVMPGEPTAVFGDALRRVSGVATYLYQDGPRYWYSTQPTVTKLAEDRAEQLRRDPDKIAVEIERRLRENLRQLGDFSRVHAMPLSGADIPDDMDARLVVLRPEHLYSREAGNPAEVAAKAILEARGNSPRVYRNTLVFLAADRTRQPDLEEAIRKYLAWDSILAEKIQLNLDPQQVKQAETQCATADSTVAVRLPESFNCLLVPIQTSPQVTEITWQAIKLSGTEPLAIRASKKLRADDLLAVALAASRLRMEMDRVPLWRGNHVTIKQIMEDFARYLYLPRVKDSTVIKSCIETGTSLVTWDTDAFGYAESFDDAAGRYRGLIYARAVNLSSAENSGLLVKPDAVMTQVKTEVSPEAALAAEIASANSAAGASTGFKGGGSLNVANAVIKDGPRSPKRFYCSANLDSTRLGRDASRLAEEIVSQFAGLAGADVKVTIEVEVAIPNGAPENVVRAVTENCRTLGVQRHGFESE
jgi:predicted AAA+ superfamily ATPase